MIESMLHDASEVMNISRVAWVRCDMSVVNVCAPVPALSANWVGVGCLPHHPCGPEVKMYVEYSRVSCWMRVAEQSYVGHFWQVSALLWLIGCSAVVMLSLLLLRLLPLPKQRGSNDHSPQMISQA